MAISPLAKLSFAAILSRLNAAFNCEHRSRTGLSRDRVLSETRGVICAIVAVIVARLCNIAVRPSCCSVCVEPPCGISRPQLHEDPRRPFLNVLSSCQTPLGAVFPCEPSQFSCSLLTFPRRVSGHSCTYHFSAYRIPSRIPVHHDHPRHLSLLSIFLLIFLHKSARLSDQAN